MSTAALQRTVRRCTAVVVAVLGLGFDGVTGFDGTLLVLGALGYLLVSVFLGLSRRYDERMDLYEDPSDEPDVDGGETVS
ncbi:hypothetical protein BRD06_00625 [Halobacteriales archaeon QS_9_67_15]|nr:MAG: hypothetical protein BRD06_00625 [Halobacteriales archaeon QS_9_67_15]